MIWEQNEGSELVVVLTMVQVEVATEVMDVIEVVADKQMHKARDEFTRGVTFHRDVFLNAFSNCLPQKMHSHTGCICGIPLCVSNVSSNGLRW